MIALPKEFLTVALGVMADVVETLSGTSILSAEALPMEAFQ
jgi:hypothetical protein